MTTLLLSTGKPEIKEFDLDELRRVLFKNGYYVIPKRHVQQVDASVEVSQQHLLHAKFDLSKVVVNDLKFSIGEQVSDLVAVKQPIADGKYTAIIYVLQELPGDPT